MDGDGVHGGPLGSIIALGAIKDPQVYDFCPRPTSLDPTPAPAHPTTLVSCGHRIRARARCQ